MISGQVPVLTATNIIAIDFASDYVQVTLGFAQMWGERRVQEVDVVGRLVLTLTAWDALKAALVGENILIKAAELLH